MHQSQLQDSRTLTLVTKTTSAAHQTSIWLSESEGLAPSPVPPALGASEPILAHQGAQGRFHRLCSDTGLLPLANRSKLLPAGETEPSWVCSSENSKGVWLLCGKYFSEEPHLADLLTPGSELSSRTKTKHFLVTQIPVTIFSSIANEIIALKELTL